MIFHRAFFWKWFDAAAMLTKHAAFLNLQETEFRIVKARAARFLICCL